jgi:hypothetical protein
MQLPENLTTFKHTVTIDNETLLKVAATMLVVAIISAVIAKVISK